MSCFQADLDRKLSELYGPLPGHWQTILRAELYALLMFLLHACPPFCMAIDNLTVMKGLSRGKAWCCAPRRAHADLWRRIWFKIEDLGVSGCMRVVFDLEGFVYDPTLCPPFRQN